MFLVWVSGVLGSDPGVIVVLAVLLIYWCETLSIIMSNKFNFKLNIFLNFEIFRTPIPLKPDVFNILLFTGVDARVLDPFTIKPLDEPAILTNAREVGGRIVVVEDHYQAGKIFLF